MLNWRDLRHPAAGGAEVYVDEVTRCWAEAGHGVTLFCASVAAAPAEESKGGVRIVRRGGRLTVYREAKRYWRSRDRIDSFDLVVDVVNTRPFHSPSFVGAVPTVALIFQVAREVWGEELPLPLALVGRYVLEPWWLRQYRRLPCLTISASSVDSLRSFGLQDVQIVPVGLRSVEVPMVPKEERPTFIYVGRLAPNKRPDHALQAFQLIRQQVESAQFWVVGDGPMLAELRRRSDPGVTIYGRVSEVEKFALLSRSHALLATSVREGWGMVVSEAAAVGTPTAAYDVAGLRDSVLASGGFLSRPTPNALAARVLEALPALLAGNVRVARSAQPWSDVADAIMRAAQERFQLMLPADGRP